MSEPFHTKGDGNHEADLEIPLDSTSTAPDLPELSGSTETNEKKATPPEAKHSEHAHTHPGIPPSPARANGKAYTEAEKQRMASLIAKNNELAAKQADITQKYSEILASLKTRDPKALVGRHIRLLHEYNEIRDSGQKLMAMIAEERGVTANEVYEEFGVGKED